MHTTTCRFPTSKKPNQRITTDSQPTHRFSEKKTTNKNYYYYRETRRTQQNFATTNPCALARLKRHHGHDHRYNTFSEWSKQEKRNRKKRRRCSDWNEEGGVVF